MLLRSGITYDPGTHSGSINISCPKGCEASWNITYHGRIIGDFNGSEPAGHTGTAVVDIEHPAVLSHRRAVTVQVADGSTSYEFARHQGPVAVRLRVR